jgi:4'-phosphopantetheinyl transferase EntD
MRLRESLLALFPPGVAGAELADRATAEPLFPEEAAAIPSAVPTRIAEFRAGRHCAREALRALGRPAEPVLRSDRAPRWPAGVVGSITHCEGFCGAVAAPVSVAAGLGFDAERAHAVSPEIWLRIASAADRSAGPPADGALRALAFSAKEALFKAQHPLTRVWMEFADASLEVADAGELRLRLECDVVGLGARGSVVRGRYALEGGLVFAAVALPPR